MADEKRKAPGAPAAILPGPPGYVMVSLADLAQLLKGVKPDSLPQVCHVMYRERGREVFNLRVQLVRYQPAYVNLPHWGEQYPQLQLTLDG